MSKRLQFLTASSEWSLSARSVPFCSISINSTENEGIQTFQWACNMLLRVAGNNSIIVHVFFSGRGALLLALNAATVTKLTFNLWTQNLTFIYPCIVNIFPNYKQQDATFFNLFISTDTVHVSGGSSVHHQEHITVHTSSGIVNQYCCCLINASS